MGAGLSGLVAAYRLESAGARVSVLEACSRVGGRLASETLAGSAFEPTGHTLPASAPDLFALVRELGQHKRVGRIPLHEVMVLVNGRPRPTSLCGGGFLRGTGLIQRSRPWGLRRVRELVAWLGDPIDRRAPERLTQLDDRSAADFVRLYLGSRALDQVFAPLLAAHFGLDADRTSRELLLLMLNVWAEPELALVFGLGELPKLLAATLPDVRTGERVETVLANGRRLRLASGKELATDAVLLATPASEVAKLVPDLRPQEQLFFGGSSYTKQIVLALALEQPLETAASSLWIPRREGGPLSAILELRPHEAEAPVSRPTLLLLGSRPGWAQAHWGDDDGELTNALANQAETIRPGLTARTAERKLLRLPASTPRFDVGHYRRLARMREAQQSSQRRIFFSGDYLIAPHAEAAVAAGERAAREILAALT